MIVAVLEWVNKTLGRIIADQKRVHYVEGDLDAPYPLFAFHVPSYDPDAEMGAFDTDDREMVISVQARSRDSLEAIRLAVAADDAMHDSAPDLGPDWDLVGRVRWAGGVPDPGNRLPDNSLVYYAGNMYALKLSRRRNVE